MKTDTQIIIALPSLVHRLGGEKVKVARAIAISFGCQLKRVRRSRNWQLLGDLQNLAEMSEHIRVSYSEELGYLLKKLSSALASYMPQETSQQKLSRLLAENPAITLSELMAETGCGLAEARSARFEQDIM